MLVRNLPNGWIIGLSNERYLSREGIDYEQKGIPPDIEVIANKDSLNAGIDNILSWALRELETLTGVSIQDGIGVLGPAYVYTIYFKVTRN